MHDCVALCVNLWGKKSFHTVDPRNIQVHTNTDIIPYMITGSCGSEHVYVCYACPFVEACMCVSASRIITIQNHNVQCCKHILFLFITATHGVLHFT